MRMKFASVANAWRNQEASRKSEYLDMWKVRKSNEGRFVLCDWFLLHTVFAFFFSFLFLFLFPFFMPRSCSFFPFISFFEPSCYV